MTRTLLQPQPADAETARGIGPDARPRRRGRLRRAFAWLVAIAVVAAAGTAAYQRMAAPPPADVRASGLIAANEVTVAARVTGRIARLLVQEGDVVAAGAPVATLDGGEIDASRQQQLAVIAELTVRLARAEDLVALESSRAEGQMARARAEVGAARSRLQQAQAELDDARAELARTVTLVEQQLAPRRERERLQAQVAVADARRAAATAAIATADADLALAITGGRAVGLAQRDVSQIRTQIDQAHAQLAQVDARRSDVTIAAPIDGVVSVRVAREGEVVNAGDPIVVLADPRDVWLRAAIDETAIGRIAVGDQLPVELPTGERRTGRVTFIAPEADFAIARDVSRARRDIRTFGVKIALPNGDRRLHAGMSAVLILPAPEVATDDRRTGR